MKRQYKGRRLARPDVILRRLIACPFLYIGRAWLFLVVLVGWGWDDAVRLWDYTR